jgi:hypothetical protein
VLEEQVNGSQSLGFFGIGGDPNYGIAGTGDFNGDGKSDILWRYNPTGGVSEALINGAQVLGFDGIGGDTNYSVVPNYSVAS